MDPDAAGLLARTLATLLRGFSWYADHHFEGLCAASRHKSLALSNKQRRQLTHVDIAFYWSRHVTATECEQLITEILCCLVPPLAATHAATATLTPVVAPVTTAYSVPILHFSGDSVGIQSCVPLNHVLSCLVQNHVVPQMPEQIVEIVNAIPQEWISERIVDISVAPTEYVTPLLVAEFTAPAPSVTHVTPSEQFSPLLQETVEVVQVKPHERLLQRTDVLAIEHSTSAPLVVNVAPSEQLSPLLQETAEVVQIGFVHPPCISDGIGDLIAVDVPVPEMSVRQERLSRLKEYDNETLSFQRFLRICNAVTIHLMDSPFRLFLSKLLKSPASRSAFESAL